MNSAAESDMRQGAAETTAHRRARGRALHWGAAAGVGGRVISVGCTLATVPIAVRHLGPTGYGLWMTMASISTLLSLSDFGIGLGARTLLARAFGHDDLSHLRTIFEACARWLAGIGLVIAGVGSAVIWLGDWGKIFRVTDPKFQAELRTGLWVLVWCCGAALPCSLAPTLAAAVQQPWLSNLATGVGGALTLAGVAVAAKFNATWPVWVAIVAGLPLLVNVALCAWLHRRLRWRIGLPRRGPPGLHREIGPLSFWFFVPQAGALFSQAAPPLVIALLVGPEPVAAFNILQRLFGLGAQIHWITLAALWPAYAEAEARHDFGWIRLEYRRSWWITLTIFVPGLVLATFFIPEITAVWIGDKNIDLPMLLIWPMAAWHFLQLIGQPPALLLNGLGRVKGVAIYGTIGHAMSLAAMIVFGQRWGTAGVILGIMAGYGVIGLPGIVVDAARRLRGLGHA